MTRVADFLRARIDDDERAILEEFERLHIRIIGETLSRAYHGSTTAGRRPHPARWCDATPTGGSWPCTTRTTSAPRARTTAAATGTDRACLVIRLLAVPYSDHPDYDEEWRP
jgi:hypothetical protein